MKIALLGDIAFFGVYCRNNKNLKERLYEISEYLSCFDIVIGNLESPFSIKQKPYGAKSAYLSSDVENSEILKWLHLNSVTLANNHMFDFGEEGYMTTIRELERLGIHYFGTDGQSWNIEKDGNKIRFMGYCCYSTNPLCLSKAQGGKGINKYNIKDVEKALLSAHDEGYFPIIAVHAGIEHVNYPSLDHVRAARKLADVAPYVYYGHHPHVVQGVEEYNGSLIAHSLGNFCFDDVYTAASGKVPLVKLSEQNRIGMILELTIEHNRIVGWKEQAILIGNDGHIRLVNYEDMFSKYNNRLLYCEEFSSEYSDSRQMIINARIAERKAKRNFAWFAKRFRMKYIRLILDMQYNVRMYKDNVTQYLR